MFRIWRFSTLGLIFALTSCVTINVYFPAAAAQDAADKVINEVWGDKPGAPKKSNQSALPSLQQPLALRLLDFFVPSAHAQANFDISTPGIQRITARMADRHGRLAAHLNSGAVGLTSGGLLSVRDPKAVPLSKRGQVTQLVAQDNADRNALYREIAAANGHSEWEPQIRATFAQRWVAKARGGWWYQGASGWQRK